MGTLIPFSKDSRGSKMPTVFDVANWFLNKEEMSHKKLQKMCYYAYSWYLTLFSKPLFNQKFEAWIHGPVCRDLYLKYKDHGWNDIKKNLIKPEMNDRIEEFLGIIYDNFGMHTADELEEMTHQEKPWRIARGDLAPSDPGVKELDDRVIVEFYSSLMEGAQVE